MHQSLLTFFPLQISASNDPLVLAMNAEHRPTKTFDAIDFVRNRRLDATVPMVNTVSKKQFEPGSRVRKVSVEVESTLMRAAHQTRCKRLHTV